MNVGVLVSGSGTNLQALIDRGTRNELGPARLTVVGCNVPDCPALSRARLAGLPTFIVDHRDHGDRAAFDRTLVEALRAHQVDLVVLAGFMRVLSGELLDFARGEPVPARARLEALVEWVRPVAEELGAAEWLAIPELNAAERQIARHDEGASLREIFSEQVRWHLRTPTS